MREDQDLLEAVDLGAATEETLGVLPGVGEIYGTQLGMGLSDAD